MGILLTRDTLLRATRRRRERTRLLRGLIPLLLGLTLHHLGHTLHSMGTLSLVATLHLVVTPNMVATLLRATPDHLGTRAAMGVAVEDTWEQCWLEAPLRLLQPMGHTRSLLMAMVDTWAMEAMEA